MKVPAQTVERIKWHEDADVNMIVTQHAREKEMILAENAGLRAMMGLKEQSSEAVEAARETEDGVNRALLMSAAEEIKRLRARVTVLEGEAARHRIQSGGFFSGFGGGGSGGADGVDSKQVAKLTTELARLGASYTLVPIRPRSRGERRSLRTLPGASLRPSLAFNPRPCCLSAPLLTPFNSIPTSLCMERPSEEDNGRQKWMIGEKDKQIKEVQGKYQASEAYALRERLQECMEALEVMANLQAQQLQYLEDNALAKLTKMDDQARSSSHWFPYGRVGAVNADP